MSWFKRSVLKQASSTGLAELERDLLERIIALPAGGCDDLCLKLQLREWLAFDREQKEGPFPPITWLRRDWDERQPRVRYTDEPPQIRVSQFERALGAAFSHPSSLVPRVWSFPFYLTPSRSASVCILMTGAVREFGIRGFELTEVVRDYPYNHCESVGPVVTSGLTAPDTLRRPHDKRLQRLHKVVLDALERNSYDRDVVILNSPIAGEHIADYSTSEPLTSLLTFSNGMRVNDLCLHAVEGRHGIRYITVEGARQREVLFDRSDDGQKILRIGNDVGRGVEFYLLIREKVVTPNVYVRGRKDARAASMSLDVIDLCLSYLKA